MQFTETESCHDLNQQVFHYNYTLQEKYLSRFLIALFYLSSFCLFNRLRYIGVPLVSPMSEVLPLASSHGTFSTILCKLGCHRQPTALSDILTRHRGIIILTLLWELKKQAFIKCENDRCTHTQTQRRMHTHRDRENNIS